MKKVPDVALPLLPPVALHLSEKTGSRQAVPESAPAQAPAPAHVESM